MCAIGEDTFLIFFDEDILVGDNQVRDIGTPTAGCDRDQANLLVVRECPKRSTFFLRQFPPTGGQIDHYVLLHMTFFPLESLFGAI